MGISRPRPDRTTRPSTRGAPACPDSSAIARCGIDTPICTSVKAAEYGGPSSAASGPYAAKAICSSASASNRELRNAGSARRISVKST